MGIYKYISKTKFLYHKLKTLIWYKIFLRKCGHGNLIINPIYITPESLVLENNIFIRNHCRLEGVIQNKVDSVPVITIESDVNIEQNAHITCGKRITIGRYTAISANVTITDITHPFDNIDLMYKFQKFEVKEVYIGSNCLILNNSVILPGVVLGNNSIVAANSVVREGVYPEYCVLAGSPAKIVKVYNHSEKKWVKN